MSDTVKVTKVMSMSLELLMQEFADGKFLLPALQREYTWTTSQIETLFDSLMQGYPINTMMFWDIDKLSGQDIDFYNFLSPNYTKGTQNSPLEHPKSSYDGKTRHIVIDGQQRITSLRIGICGSYKTKEARYEKRLRLRLDSKPDADDEGKEYDFRFLTEPQFNKNNETGQCWVTVGDVCEKKFDEIDFVLNNNLQKNEFARQTLTRLKSLFSNNDVISYYSITDHDNIDDVLDIFVRTNSGGTKLTKGDLLLSSFTTDWAAKNENGRKYVEDIINEVKDRTTFNVSKDWMLKSFSMMVGEEVKVNVSSFKKMGISEKVYEDKEKVADCIINAFCLVKDFGLVKKGLTANLAVMPIAYYWYKHNKKNKKITNNDDVYYAMRQFVFSAILQQLFQSQTDQTLIKVRKAIETARDFSFDEICRELPELRITDDDISNFLRKPKKEAFPYLNIVYALEGKKPDSNTKYDVDHIHPDKLCQLYMQEGLIGDEYDTLPNLQLLSEKDNRSKNAMSLADWAKDKEEANAKEFEHWKQNNFIPDGVSFEKEAIQDLLTKRSEKLREVFEELK